MSAVNRRKPPLRCEIWVEATQDQHRRLCEPGFLSYDKRDEGARGRALLRPFPELGLEAGDRLEPHLELMDVGKFELVAPADGATVRVLF